MFHNAAVVLVAWSPFILRYFWRWFRDYTLRQAQRANVESVLDHLNHRTQ